MARQCRELANVMEHAFILAGGGQITSEHLPHHLLISREPSTLPLPRPQVAQGTVATSAPRTLKEIEMDHIFKVLEKHKGNKPAAATELGIVLKTLYNKLNQWEEERKNAG